MNLKSAITGALLLMAASAAGCGTSAAQRGDWEAELRGAYSPNCRNLSGPAHSLLTRPWFIA
jgi:hypothetical protein